MTPRPLAPIAIAVACGIVLAAHASFVACLFAAAVLLVFLPIAKTAAYRTTLVVVAASFVVGAARYAVSCEVPVNDVSRFVDGASSFEGKVISDPEWREDRVRVVVRVNRVQTARGWFSATGRVMINVYQPAARELNLNYGDRIRARVLIYKPRDATNPGQVQWRSYLARQRIYACASIRQAEQLSTIERRKGNLFVASAVAAKNYVVTSVSRSHSHREAMLVNGMVLGTYSCLTSDVLQAFTRTGTLHLLAASGYNCFVLVFIASPILTLLRIIPKHKNLIIILLLFWYLMMVGAKPSLLRATVMASLYLFGVHLKRVPDVKNLFFAAMLIVLMISPADLFDVGFQLSFLGVWGLINAAPIIEHILRSAGWGAGPGFEKRGSAWSWLSRKTYSVVGGVGAATITVTLVTAPLVAYYFNYFSTVSLPANIILGIGVPVVFADGLISAFFGWVPILGRMLGTIGTAAAGAMLKTVETLGSPSWAAVSVPSPSPLAIVGYYIVLFGLYDYVRPKHDSRS